MNPRLWLYSKTSAIRHAERLDSEAVLEEATQIEAHLLDADSIS